ncbi:MAG: hypothetical protein WBY53_11160 [Acidobacteriaceae bacterium]
MFLLAVLLSSLATVPQPVRPVDGQSIMFGQATARLDGPWRFHAGDNPAWSTTGFDDSKWENVSLAAAQGSHDADVGLSDYVTGWGARGHRGLSGYGWYRLHLHVDVPHGQSLTIAGPPAVDSAYQIFWNGQLLGSAGDFRNAPPRAFSIRPRIFAIDQSSVGRGDGTDVLAVRVWMGPWELADPQGGGIRIAPTLGTAAAIKHVYQSEWIETLRGYIVEVAEAVGFAILCLALWLVSRFDRRLQQYRWFYAAFLLTGAYRLNQAIFFWGQFESVPVFECISLGLMYPLALSAWTISWARLVAFRNKLWTRAFVAITLVYLSVALTQHAILSRLAQPAHETILHAVAVFCRMFYLASTAWFLFKLLRSQCRYRWALAWLIVLASVGQFATELSQIGVPGIWFPFGTGVSRAQFAYALFLVIAPTLLCLHYLGLTRERRREHAPQISARTMP